MAMCAVYSNCHVALAGMSSSICQQGLYCGGLGATELNGETPDGKPYDLFAREHISHYVSEYPLLGRAWCFQETLLAPRTLYFGAKEMLWLCREGQGCQCKLVSNHRFLPNQDLIGDSPLFKLPSRTVGNAPFNPVVRWHKLIRAYSKT
ncbi:hypothetical protein IMZ48_22075, partial [Candidatus Bathyarchaeota archaeon]|nr:hypothetical protein [Candidatus Bathyarchaeota archaeon]